MNEALKPFFARSLGLHAGVFVALLLLGGRSARKADKVYMIDFVGGTTISAAGPAAAAPAVMTPPAPAKAGPQADPDALAAKGGRRPLPRPSLLRGARDEAPAPAAAAPASPAVSAAAAPAGPSGGGASAGVSTDLPNFPYPWYISQVRQMLWQAWRKRMPRVEAEGVVVFSILRSGASTDLRVESSSGDEDFDRAALESVKAAAPFPELPRDFREPFLKVHLSLKSESGWR